METFTKGKKVACPASAEFLDPLAAGYKLHYATPAELKKHHGVCAKCAEKFKKHNAAILEGKVESPVSIESHHDLTVETDHAGYDAHGEVVQAVDFDYGEVDSSFDFAKLTTSTGRHEAAEAFSLLLNWIWAGGFHSAQKKFCVLTAGIRPDLLDNETYEQLAAKLGCTKAALSKAAKVAEQRLKIRFSRSRSAAACETMAQAQIGHAPTNTKRNGQANVTT